MKIFWNGDVERPQEALEYSAEALIEAQASSRWESKIVGNPAHQYEGPETNSHGTWVEIYTDHRLNQVDNIQWATSRIEGPVGVISGFGAAQGIELIRKLRTKKTKPPVPLSESEASILYLNGPNLNLLGTREPEIYGKQTLSEIFKDLMPQFPNVIMNVAQSNNEGDLVQMIQDASQKFDAIIINAAAYTHTSIAIHDALKSFDDVIIELHISNPHQRETFRHRSFVAPVSDGLIAGFGARGYEVATLAALLKL